MLIARSVPFGVLARISPIQLWQWPLKRFNSSSITFTIQYPPRLILKEEDVHEAFVHGTGPGGQKINKTACAVQLKHKPTGISTLCQESRSRAQNRKIARRLLAEKVENAERGDESRMALKAAVKSRKKASKTKKARRKYKALAGVAAGNESQGTEEEAEEEAEEERVVAASEVNNSQKQGKEEVMLVEGGEKDGKGKEVHR